MQEQAKEETKELPKQIKQNKPKQGQQGQPKELTKEEKDRKAIELPVLTEMPVFRNEPMVVADDNGHSSINLQLGFAILASIPQNPYTSTVSVFTI